MNQPEVGEVDSFGQPRARLDLGGLSAGMIECLYSLGGELVPWWSDVAIQHSRSLPHGPQSLSTTKVPGEQVSQDADAYSL